MAAADGAAALLMVGNGPDVPEFDRAGFGRVFCFPEQPSGNTVSARVCPITRAELDASLLNRLAFFADPQAVPFLWAPLLIQYIWREHGDVGNVIVVHEGVPVERAQEAQELLDARCNAVLLRVPDIPAIPFAFARTLRNERIVAHWADCVMRCPPEDLQSATQLEVLCGATLLEHLVPRLGSLRISALPRPKMGHTPANALPAIVREAIYAYFPRLPELREDPLANAAQALNAPSDDLGQESTTITRLMHFVWGQRRDLQDAFDLSSARGRNGLVQWFRLRGQPELGLTEQFLPSFRFSNLLGLPRTNGWSKPSPVRRHGPVLDPESGVNLVGYARAEMGMGEQLRSCAAALEAVRTPFSILDFRQGLVASNQDERFEHLIGDDLPYAVNLIHVNPDQIGLLEEAFGRQLFRDRYNIAYWEWELSRFPDAWLPVLDRVDEIWAPSRFIAQAIAEKTTKPVVHMPLAVEYEAPRAFSLGAPGRARFNLSLDSFVFLFAFDFSSFATRKNYQAVVEAFQQAFPHPAANVSLVLKTIRHPHQHRELWRLLDAVADDRRIVLIDAMLRRSEMRELMQACDALVSLHRSEGFGLSIAEAMYLNKPVVVTNYSGNTDFTLPSNSCLVDYTLVPVNRGEYVHEEGQVWAEPDVEMAASHMRKLVSDPEHAATVGRIGGEYLRLHHSPAAVGTRYQARLRSIAEARRMLAAPISDDNADANIGLFRAVPSGTESLMRRVARRLF